MGFVGSEPSQASVSSAGILDGAIVDADINASAAIAISKTAFSAGTGVTLSTNTLNIDAAQTGITSLLATNIKIGEDDQTKIDFEDDNKINFYANNAKEVELAENSLSPGTSDGTALGTTSLMWSDLFIADGGVINFNNGDVTLTHSSNTLTIAGGDLAATISTASQPNITTLAGLTTIGAVANALAMTFSDVTLFHDANNADTSFSIGTSATEALKIEVLNGGSNKTAEEVHFSTATASGTADHGKMVFDIDGTDIFSVDDNGVNLLADSSILSIGADNDATLTHDGTTGLTIAATPISIDSTGELHLNSTTGDIKLQDGGTDQITFDLDGTAGEVIMKPAVDSDDLVISQYDGTEVIRIEDNASLGLVGNKLSIANSSSDVVIKPLTDAKDIIFQQYDGTEVARIEDNATFNVSSAGKFAYAGTAVTATAAELNLLDGGTSVGGSITLADSDGVVVNDGGTMKTIPASDLSTYIGSAGQFTATAAEAISAGDAVAMDSTGKVGPIKQIQGVWNNTDGDRDYDFGANSEDSYVSYGISTAYDPDTDRHLVVWSNAAYDIWSVVVARNAGNADATFGTPVKIHNSTGASDRGYGVSCTYDTSADRFLVMYSVDDSSARYNSAIMGRVGTVTGGGTNSVAYGTATTIRDHAIDWTAAMDSCVTYATSANRHVYVNNIYNYASDNSFDSAGSASITVEVTGGGTNTPSAGTYLVIDGTSNQGDSNSYSICWDETNDRLLVIQSNSSTKDFDYAVGSISGSTITWGSMTEFDDTNDSQNSQCGSACIHDPATNRTAVLISRTAQSDCVFYVANIASSGQTMTSITLHDSNVVSDKSGGSQQMNLGLYASGTGLGYLAVTDQGTNIQLKTWSIDATDNEVDVTANSTKSTGYYTINYPHVLMHDTTLDEFIFMYSRSTTAHNFRYSNVTVAATLDYNKIDSWVGVAGSAISKDASGTITTVGGNVGGFSGLTIGAYYTVSSTGEYGTSDANNATGSSVKVGFANSASTIQITGSMNDTG